MKKLKFLILTVIFSATAVVLYGSRMFASVNIGVSPGRTSHSLYQKALNFDHTLPATLTGPELEFSDNLTYVDISSNNLKISLPALNRGLFNRPVINCDVLAFQTRQHTFYHSKTPTLNSVLLE